MIVILGFVAVLAFGVGTITMLIGTSAIHQILTAVYFLTFTVSISGIAIVVTLDQVKDRLPRPRPKVEPTTSSAS